MQNTFKKWWPVYLLLGGLFALLVFFRLDRFYLWQDEADQALLSLSILKTGLPRALIDGKLITQWNGAESSTHYLWFFNPWLPLYLTAFSFKIFGVSTWAARFPFAFLGVVSIWPLGLLFWRWTRSHAVTALALFLFVTNPWVVLYTRQAKYFPIIFFGSALMYLGYQKWEEQKNGTLLFVIGVCILFHCNYFTLALVLAGLGIYTLLFAKWPKALPRFVTVSVLTLAFFCLPFFLAGSIEKRVTMMGTLPTLFQYFSKLGTHIFYFNRQICPLLLIFLWGYWWRKKIWTLLENKTLVLLFISVVTAWCGVALLNYDVLRYNLQLIPLFCLLMAVTLAEVFKKKRMLATFLFVLLWGTNLLQQLPETLKDLVKTPQNLSIRKNVLKEEWWAMKNYYFKNYPEPARLVLSKMNNLWRNGEFVYLNYSQPVWQFYSNIPLAYQVDPALAPPKEPPLKPEWREKKYIDWWIGPFPYALGRGPNIKDEELIETWQQQTEGHEVIDTHIPMIYWEMNQPIRYRKFLEKFSDDPPASETIKIIHRIQRAFASLK
ncbi:MAG: glycosyltransferase family 39 protein [Deltaproteobacteria bacterium]|nr:glycosyltransferase family 39 protein [Deltaproteobacteria bacterium]